MSSSLSARAIGAIGAIVVLITFACFLLAGFDWSAANIIGLGFLLLAEVVLTVGLIAMRHIREGYNKVMLEAGTTSAMVLYSAATVVVGFLAGAFRHRTGWYLLIELVLVSSFAVVMIALVAISHAIDQRDSRDFQKIGSEGARRGGF